MMFDYCRISCAVPNVVPADVDNNVKEICECIAKAESLGSAVVLFPELSVTGYTCGDLLFQSSLVNAAKNAVKTIADATSSCDVIAVVGTPVLVGFDLYDCAVVIAKGRVQGIVPKVFCDKRWFTSNGIFDLSFVNVNTVFNGFSESYAVPFGMSVFNVGNVFKFAVAVGDDINAPVATPDLLTLKGAEILFNVNAFEQLVGRDENLKTAAQSISKRNVCTFVSCSAGKTESTSDSVFAGASVIAQNGKILKVNDEFIDGGYMLTADVDLGPVKSNRIKSETFKLAASMLDIDELGTVDIIGCDAEKCCGELLYVSKTPFIPEDKHARINRCCDIFNMQVEALKRRVEVTGSKLVVGISGGLDSTLALLVAAECMKRLRRPSTDVYGITMPCFGTSDRTLKNSLDLMNLLKVSSKIISIKDACIQHFKDISHPLDSYDVTYENAQARERTQVLMDFAGKVGGFVVGTGDLSELALGWCTYNGDHMSMYSVNCDIPKTLVRWIIASLVECDYFEGCGDVLNDILGTPISPELLPPDAKGEIAQVTEDIVGPYVLHDFFLYYVVRFGYEPKKIYDLAKKAFQTDFEDDEIKKWLKSFYRRFFTQQFKRNCVPDGVKVGSISLSPRGDFKMPSDAVSKIWQSQVDEL
ncbi:MAG: NAD(+) synthase [Ruminococcaceae bacterium]|nr:NAD(+) synthase [Oscillospiraceae bacterium]